MEGQKIRQEIESTGKGLERLLGLCEHIPSETEAQIKRVTGLAVSVVKMLENAVKEAEDIKRKAYKEGFEAGREEGLRSCADAAEKIIQYAEHIREKDVSGIRALFGKFIGNLSRHISSQNLNFFEEYIRRYVERAESEKIRIVISDTLYQKIAGRLIQSGRAELVPDPSLSEEQIFVETGGTLSDAGIDRFFEELSV